MRKRATRKPRASGIERPTAGRARPDQITNSSQSVTDTQAYDAFGNLESSTGSNPTPFQYDGGWGYQADADSGLMLLGHRYYDPCTGRFLTRDPAKEGRNWSTYAGHNPLRFSDNQGLMARGLTSVNGVFGFLGIMLDLDSWLGMPPFILGAGHVAGAPQDIGDPEDPNPQRYYTELTADGLDESVGLGVEGMEGPAAIGTLGLAAMAGGVVLRKGVAEIRAYRKRIRKVEDQTLPPDPEPDPNPAPAGPGAVYGAAAARNY